MHFLTQALFGIYRLLGAPLAVSMGAGCRFYPSCSHYAQEALRRHGWWKGAGLTLKRLCRCHPGNPGGIDEVI